MRSVARDPAYHLAAATLQDVGDITISGRHLRNLTVQIGGELEQDRDARTDAYFGQSLPRVSTAPITPILLACVSLDGGRMQTRLDGGPNGVQEPHWRETKNALFLRMTGVQFREDPHPDLPVCFRDRQYMKKLLSGVAEEGDFNPPDVAKSDLHSWRPKRLFRTCLSSLCDSDSFGRMMEAEADSRGFFKAEKQAFVGDGLAYNWTVQQRHFPQFVPILDFPHVIERTYEAARAVADNSDVVWERSVRWATACWQGRVREVLEELNREQQRLGKPPQGCDDKDPRKVLAETITYLENNRERMKYPEYRQAGLPITTAWMESLVKEVNYRVKGTEMFWNHPEGAEAILQVRAAALSDDDRLSKHLRTRPGCLFTRRRKAAPTAVGTNVSG